MACRGSHTASKTFLSHKRAAATAKNNILYYVFFAVCKAVDVFFSLKCVHVFEFQRFVDSSVPLPTQEVVAAKRARTHGEWHCNIVCNQVEYVSLVNIFLFPWRQVVVSGEVFICTSLNGQAVESQLTKHVVALCRELIFVLLREAEVCIFSLVFGYCLYLQVPHPKNYSLTAL